MERIKNTLCRNVITAEEPPPWQKRTFLILQALSISGDFLENYCEEDDMANIARLLVAVFILILYPLECHGGREVVLVVIK